MKYKLKNYLPIGVNAVGIISAIIISLVLSIVIASFSFLRDYHLYLKSLYRYQTISPENLLADQTMVPFVILIERKLLLFTLFILTMIALIIYNYRWHYIGSNSAYTMQRLPQKYALHGRCLTVPVIAIISALVVMVLLLFCYYQYYWRITPHSNLELQQFNDLISILIRSML